MATTSAIGAATTASSSNIDSGTSVPGSINLADIPPLYPQFHWVPTSTADFSPGAVVYDRYNFASLSGSAWFASTTLACGQSPDLNWMPFQKYYANELNTKRGWTYDAVAVNGIRFQPDAVGGPDGEIDGAIATDGVNIREILISYSYDAVGNCPQELDFEVFVSNIVPANEVVASSSSN